MTAREYSTAMPCDQCGAAAGELCKPRQPIDCECSACVAQARAVERGEMFHAGGAREIGGMVCERFGFVPPDLPAQVEIMRAELDPPKRRRAKRSAGATVGNECQRKPGRPCQADYGEPARCEWCDRVMP